MNFPEVIHGRKNGWKNVRKIMILIHWKNLISSEWMKMICEQVDQTLNDLEMIRTEALKVANSP